MHMCGCTVFREHAVIITVKKNCTESLHQSPLGIWVHFSISAAPVCESPAFISYHNHRIGISLGFKQTLSIKITSQSNKKIANVQMRF